MPRQAGKVRGLAWPETAEHLIAEQQAIAARLAGARATSGWRLGADPVIGGCFLAYAPGEAGPGHPGDRAWGAAVLWQPSDTPHRRNGSRFRSPDRALTGVPAGGQPRQARDVIEQSVVAGRVLASYLPGLLALREGPLLSAAVAALDRRPDVLLVDGTGLDHPRQCGLAVHVGAILGLATVGVTQRPLVAEGIRPAWQNARRGPLGELRLGGQAVARWVCTRSGAVPVLAHPGWLTDLDSAEEVVLTASTEAARTPVPLQEARRVAREARAIAGATGT
jgi:deoxyribonuclease V